MKPPLLPLNPFTGIHHAFRIFAMGKLITLFLLLTICLPAYPDESVCENDILETLIAGKRPVINDSLHPGDSLYLVVGSISYDLNGNPKHDSGIALQIYVYNNKKLKRRVTSILRVHVFDYDKAKPNTSKSDNSKSGTSKLGKSKSGKLELVTSNTGIIELGPSKIGSIELGPSEPSPSDQSSGYKEICQREKDRILKWANMMDMHKLVRERPPCISNELEYAEILILNFAYYVIPPPDSGAVNPADSLSKERTRGMQPVFLPLPHRR